MSLSRTDDGDALLQQAQELGHEARVRGSDHASLKLWLRLLACTTEVEKEIRSRLRSRFGISLARFDYMAQLFRHRDGLKMKALSNCLMVTGGNITGLTDELERDELVVRERDPLDRRSSTVRLTAKGRRVFETMAGEHERWILELLGSLDATTTEQLYQSLGKLRVQMAGNPP